MRVPPWITNARVSTRIGSHYESLTATTLLSLNR